MRLRRSKTIRQGVFEEIFLLPASPVNHISQYFGITRQAVQLHLRALADQDAIIGEGKARWRQYRLATTFRRRVRFALEGGFSEYVAWEKIGREIGDLTAEERELFNYGV